MALWAVGFRHTHTLIKYPAEFLRGTLWRSPMFFLCADPSYPVFCPNNFSCHGLQSALAMCRYLGSPLSFDFVSPLSTWPLVSLKAGIGASSRAHIVSCLSRIFVLHCLISRVLQTIISYILSSFLRCFSVQGKVESHLYMLILYFIILLYSSVVYSSFLVDPLQFSRLYNHIIGK